MVMCFEQLVVIINNDVKNKKKPSIRKVTSSRSSKGKNKVYAGK